MAAETARRDASAVSGYPRPRKVSDVREDVELAGLLGRVDGPRNPVGSSGEGGLSREECGEGAVTAVEVCLRSFQEELLSSCEKSS